MDANARASSWLRLPEAAAYLDCSERYLREVAKARKIRSSLVAQRLHFKISDLDAFIEACSKDVVR